MHKFADRRGKTEDLKAGRRSQSACAGQGAHQHHKAEPSGHRVATDTYHHGKKEGKGECDALISDEGVVGCEKQWKYDHHVHQEQTAQAHRRPGTTLQPQNGQAAHAGLICHAILPSMLRWPCQELDGRQGLGCQCQGRTDNPEMQRQKQHLNSFMADMRSMAMCI